MPNDNLIEQMMVALEAELFNRTPPPVVIVDVPPRPRVLTVPVAYIPFDQQVPIPPENVPMREVPGGSCLEGGNLVALDSANGPGPIRDAAGIPPIRPSSSMSNRRGWVAHVGGAAVGVAGLRPENDINIVNTVGMNQSVVSVITLISDLITTRNHINPVIDYTYRKYETISRHVASAAAAGGLKSKTPPPPPRGPLANLVTPHPNEAPGPKKVHGGTHKRRRPKRHNTHRRKPKTHKRKLARRRKTRR
jgi:hypothetical protein